jgi:Lrp/AsnC family transcriptional regulator for asnA, asnC and gidA
MGKDPWHERAKRANRMAQRGGASYRPRAPCCWRAERGGAAGVGMSEPVLDAVNKQIIEQLQRDGRMSYASLAKIVGLSEAAVRQRVQRLLDAGVMQIVAVTDPLTLGFARQVMVGIRVSGDIRPVAKALAAIPEVDYVVICAGGYDLLAELVCTDDDHLLVLLNDTIRAVPGVAATETFVYLKLAKQTYAWGTR